MNRATETKSSATDVIHLDLDCFFASVEARDDPSLVGKPVVVGGLGPRGVVASSSYEARAYGIRSATSMAQARALCPSAVFVSPRRGAYEEASRELLSICARITPIVEPIALDEAFLDVAGAHSVHGSSQQIASTLRASVLEEIALACAVGIGRTKLIAKLASNAAKPHPSVHGPRDGKGVVIVLPEEEPSFLQSHSLRALPGVGPRTGERLLRLGISTIADLLLIDQTALIAHFGQAHGKSLYDLARGIDNRKVTSDRAMKSIGHEETFDVDIYDGAVLALKAREMAAAVAHRARSSHLAGKTVSVKVRFGDFSSVSRAKSATRPTVTGAEIGAIATDLLQSIDLGAGVRLLGVSLGNLESAELTPGVQLDFFGPALESLPSEPAVNYERREELESATDEIKRRFGNAAISPAAALGPSGRRSKGESGPFIRET